MVLAGGDPWLHLRCNFRLAVPQTGFVSDLCSFENFLDARSLSGKAPDISSILVVQQKEMTGYLRVRELSSRLLFTNLAFPPPSELNA